MLSIITISKNNVVGLTKTLESVSRQYDFSKVQLIIVDGHSTDGSDLLIYEFLDRDCVGVLINEHLAGKENRRLLNNRWYDSSV